MWRRKKKRRPPEGAPMEKARRMGTAHHRDTENTEKHRENNSVELRVLCVSVVFLLFPFAVPLFAVFEDNPAGARQLGFGGQAAALEDPLSFYSNPALLGGSDKFETGAHFLASDRTTEGQEKF